jgi:hypothetical protein
MSFWLEQYYLALGWLIFKLGAKWASWQHVVKIPEGTRDDDACLRDRLFLAARLLGRFLNGTAYNIFCAGIGGSLAMFVRYYYYPLFAFFPTYWLAIVGAILNVVALLVMFCALWCKPRTAEDTVEAP